MEGLVRRLDEHQLQSDKEIKQIQAAFQGLSANVPDGEALTMLHATVVKLEQTKADKVGTHFFLAPSVPLFTFLLSHFKSCQ